MSCYVFRYGDIAPRNPVGRFFGVIFMVFGLIVSSLMAALMTEAVNKVDILSYIHEVFKKTFIRSRSTVL